MTTRGRKANLKVIEGGLTDAPEMPARIPEQMRPEWDAVVSDLAKRRVLTEAMLSVVETFVFAMLNFRQAQEAIEKHGVLVIGRDGLAKQNPAISLLGKSQGVVQRLSLELGLTPAARSRSDQSNKETDFGDDGQFSLLDL